jgi:hypothetical protein
VSFLARVATAAVSWFTSEAVTILQTWQGQPPPAHILVLQEANLGYGDAFMACRYVPMLARCGYQVAFKPVKPGLSKLLRHSFNDLPDFRDNPALVSGALLPPTYQFPLEHLPAAFNGKTTPHRVHLHQTVIRPP